MMQKIKYVCVSSALLLYPIFMHSMLPTGFEEHAHESYENIVKAGIKTFQNPAVKQKHHELLEHSKELLKVYMTEISKELSNEEKQILRNVLGNILSVSKEANKIAKQIAPFQSAQQKDLLFGSFMASIMMELNGIAIFGNLMSAAIDKYVKSIQADPDSNKNAEETFLNFVKETVSNAGSYVEELKEIFES